MKLEADRSYVQLTVPDLEPFLLSNELYWPQPNLPASLREPGLDRMSLGGIMLALRRLEAAGIDGGTEHLHAQAAKIRSQWLSNWQRKAGREFGERLGRWRQLVGEWSREKPVQRAYVAQTRLRAMLQVLYEEGEGHLPADAETLHGADLALRKLGKPGEFVWEAEVSAGFPADRFWFLYLNLT